MRCCDAAIPHPFAEGLEVSHVASVPGGLDHNQGSNGMASLGQAFRHDIVAYKAPRYCFQPLLPGSRHFIIIIDIAIFPKLPLPAGLTNKSLPFLQCRSGSRNVLARASGPVTRAALRKNLKGDV